MRESKASLRVEEKAQGEELCAMKEEEGRIGEGEEEEG